MKIDSLGESLFLWLFQGSFYCANGLVLSPFIIWTAVQTMG